jgi:hypothetical protein
VMRLEQRGGVAIAFMAAALCIMLLIAAWEYLFSPFRATTAQARLTRAVSWPFQFSAWDKTLRIPERP